jgi:hypothetical protein
VDQTGFSKADAAPVLAMLAILSPVALAELESALAAALNPVPSPSERRVAELGYLALLLSEIQPPLTHLRTESGGDRGRRKAPELRVPRLRREVYETRQPVDAPDAPSAAKLVLRYASWLAACKAAYGLRDDGRYVGAGNPWRQPLAGRSRPTYNLDDALAAIRRCARELGRIPSAGDYHQWARDAKRLARQRGVRLTRSNPSEHPLIPGIAVIYRLYPKTGNAANRWRAALADVGLTEPTIAAARKTRLGLDTNPNPPKADKQLMALPLSKAIARARADGVSLDYLAGRSLRHGTPPAEDASFNASALVKARDQSNVPDERLRHAVGMQLGPWRRFLKGQIEPTLRQLVSLAALVDQPLDALVCMSPPRTS